ncbi:hypothetical protein C8R45DRAFT_936561 [Mycena sanguinolenta]|nr:hypothetical protein C8R45DRAFT_936561 [Mycena sanguinolenta]
MSIRFRPADTYSNKPEAEEFVRKSVGRYLKKKKLAGKKGTAEVAGGAHTGGTDPRSPLHSTVKILDEYGNHVKTVHINHDPSILGLNNSDTAKPQHPEFENRVLYWLNLYLDLRAIECFSCGITGIHALRLKTDGGLNVKGGHSRSIDNISRQTLRIEPAAEYGTVPESQPNRQLPAGSIDIKSGDQIKSYLWPCPAWLLSIMDSRQTVSVTMRGSLFIEAVGADRLISRTWPTLNLSGRQLNILVLCRRRILGFRNLLQISRAQECHRPCSEKEQEVEHSSRERLQNQAVDFSRVSLQFLWHALKIVCCTLSLLFRCMGTIGLSSALWLLPHEQLLLARFQVQGNTPDGGNSAVNAQIRLSIMLLNLALNTALSSTV